MRFVNRDQAGEMLAVRLAAWRGSRPLVLAIPRGAVPMAAVIAAALDGDLDVALVHKLGAPGNPELAIGSVDEEGRVEANPLARQLGVPEEYVRAEASAQVARLASRRRDYGGAPLDPGGRVVIVVDDGAATGSTLLAALRLVRRRRPARLIAALAVAPSEVVRALGEIADEVVCLATPPEMRSVGEFFGDFRQVEDDAVRATLARCRTSAPGPSGQT